MSGKNINFDDKNIKRIDFYKNKNAIEIDKIDANKPESSKDFTILIMSFISSFDIISVVLLPDPKIFLCIPASAADVVAVNPKGIKTLLANGLIAFFKNGSPVFSNGLTNLPRNPPECIILDN